MTDNFASNDISLATNASGFSFAKRSLRDEIFADWDQATARELDTVPTRKNLKKVKYDELNKLDVNSWSNAQDASSGFSMLLGLIFGIFFGLIIATMLSLGTILTVIVCIVFAVICLFGGFCVGVELYTRYKSTSYADEYFSKAENKSELERLNNLKPSLQAKKDRFDTDNIFMMGVVIDHLKSNVLKGLSDRVTDQSANFAKEITTPKLAIQNRIALAKTDLERIRHIEGQSERCEALESTILKMQSTHDLPSNQELVLYEKVQLAKNAVTLTNGMIAKLEIEKSKLANDIELFNRIDATIAEFAEPDEYQSLNPSPNLRLQQIDDELNEIIWEAEQIQMQTGSILESSRNNPQITNGSRVELFICESVN